MELLSFADIKQRYDREWVLLEDPTTDAQMQVQSGIVRWHSKDRDEVYRKAIELRPRRFAMLYTGTLPQNTAIAL
jgi:hypothetical protein